MVETRHPATTPTPCTITKGQQAIRMKTFTVAAAATMALAIGVQGQTLPPDFTSIPSCAVSTICNGFIYHWTIPMSQGIDSADDS